MAADYIFSPFTVDTPHRFRVARGSRTHRLNARNGDTIFPEAIRRRLLLLLLLALFRKGVQWRPMAPLVSEPINTSFKFLASFFDRPAKKTCMVYGLYANPSCNIISLRLLQDKQEDQLPLRNRASAMHFFVAKLLSIAIMTYTYVYHLRNLRPMVRLKN